MSEILKEIKRKVQKGSSFLFSDWQTNTLAYKSLDFLRDTYDKGYIFFRNGVVEVTRDTEILHPYEKLKDMKKYVWQRQIIDRDFTPTKSPSVFNDFLLNSSSYKLNKEQLLTEIVVGETHAETGDRFVRMSDYWSKITAFGYLLHSYKNHSKCPAILCTDAEISEKGVSEGGVGKSLFAAQALSHIRNTLQMDGQSIDPADRFCFQQVTLDTQAICIDDANYKLNFNMLFQRTTGDFTVESKGKPKFTIPFEKSPKLSITTNHTLRGKGNSYGRRQHILQFSDFYRHNRLVDVHGKPFFTAWNDEEWSAFFSFAIGCIKAYLERGLISPIIKSYDERKMLASIPEGFIEWCDSAIQTDKEYERDTLLADYKKCTGDVEVEPRNFTEFIKRWVEHRKFIYNPKTNGKRIIRNGVTFIEIAKPK